MVNIILGTKQEQSQKFLEDGTRIPVTRVLVPDNTVLRIKTAEKNGYQALQFGILSKKKATKSEIGLGKGANLKDAPRFLREVGLEEEDLPNFKVGDVVKASDVLKPGDIVSVTGVSKGKGYAGVVKRHNFKGGPKTHGQSDRERAPGSIGQTTTPGRVYKGKRMSGRMGNENVTVKNLEIIAVLEDEVLIKGLIPGIVDNLITIRKTGEKKKFVPLFEEEDKKIKEEKKVETEEKTVEEIKEEPRIEEPVVEAKEEVKDAK